MQHSLNRNDIPVQVGNPLREKAAKKPATSSALKVENLMDARKITTDELQDFISNIESTE